MTVTMNMAIAVQVGYYQTRQQQTLRYFYSKMSEGRKTQIVLLDERKLEILIQPKLYAGELLDLVASHFSLKEKEYFGLAFKDETEHFHWLQLDRKVLEHEFPKKTSDKEPLLLYFSVRFFIESIAYLRDGATIELFFLQAKHSLYKGTLECDSETVFELAAHVLQSKHGDFTDDLTAIKQLKKLPVLPTSTLKEHPSLNYCEDRVIEHYKKLSGTARGSGVVNYMTIVESLPTYGIHYYEVKDKSHIPWWLGLSYKGISLYDYSDKRVPRKVFAWKQLENLYFRDKKFSIEVHDPKRIVHTLSSFNLYEDAIQESVDEFDELSDAISDPTTQVSVSRRTFGPGNVNVHAWFASTPQLTKCIWSMAVSQHQFYLDRKQSKSQLPSVRSMSEIAADLCTSTTSLPSSGYSGGNISRSNSAASLGQLSSHNSKTELTQEDIDNSRQAQRDMYAALKSKREVLEERMRKKTEKLKELCLKEAELTGELPFETPLTPGEPLPQIRRRVGTTFSLSNILWLKEQGNEEEEMISKLELEYEIHKKIAEAALRLAKDHTVAKSVRKKRKQAYHKINQQFKDIEKKLNEFRLHKGKTPLHKKYASTDELSEDSREFLDSDNEFLSPVSSPHISRHENYHHLQQQQGGGSVGDISGGGGQHYSSSNSSSVPRNNSSAGQVEVVELDASGGLMRPSTPSSQGSGQNHPQYTHGISRGSTPSPGPTRQYGPGERYTPSAVYTTRTAYRNQSYPTFNNHQGSYQPVPPNQVYGGNQQPQYGNGNPGSNSDYDNTPYEGGEMNKRRMVSDSRLQSSNSIPSSPQHTLTAAQQQEYIHNMYNLNLNRTSHYESGDELKSPTNYQHHAEYYDSFPTDADPHHHNNQHYHQRGIPRTNSFESTSSSRGGISSNENYNRGYQQYGSLDRNTGLPYRQDDELSEMSIPELLPTKFGSKRESHSDKRDSPYYTGNDQYSVGYRGPNYDHQRQQHDMQQQSHYSNNHHPHIPHQQVPHQEYGIPSQGGGDRTPQQVNSSHSSLTSSASSNNYYYEQQNRDSSSSNNPSGVVRQQAPPSTPQFESPPPAFIRQDVPPLYHHPPHSQHPQQQQSPYESPHPQNNPPTGNVSQTPSQRPMTVTKYSNYVEVSKPFEMADVYRYSEKMRKVVKPGGEMGDGSIGSGGSGQASPSHHGGSVQRLNSPYMQRAAIVNHSASRSRSNSPNSILSQEAGYAATVGNTANHKTSPYVQTPPTGNAQSSSRINYHHHQHHYQQQNKQSGYSATAHNVTSSASSSSLTNHSHPSNSANQNTPNMQYQQSPQYNTPPQGSNISTPHRSLNETTNAADNQSFGSFHNDSVSRAFSQEMLAWYEDQDGPEPPTQPVQSPDSATLV